MSGLAHRLVRLERLRPPRRCDTCRGWPAARVIDTDPEMAALSARWAAQWDLPAGQAIPERCPGCGWEPLAIRVEYVEDWGPA